MLQIPKTTDKLKRFSLDPASIIATVKSRDVEKSDESKKKRKKRSARRRFWTIFGLIVILPTVLTILYFLVIASDQYASTAEFSVRGAETPSADLLGMMTGMSGGTTANAGDSHVVASYILSRNLVEDLDKKINLRKIYSRPEADYFAAFNPKKSVEDLVSYWASRVTIYFDTFTGITKLEVRAFRDKDAKLVADHVLAMSERLVNEISRKARDDAVRESKLEVARSENRLRLARLALTNFRNTNTTFDPSKVAEGKQAIIQSLDSQLVKLRTELKELLTTMSARSPKVVDLQRQIKAVEEQTKAEKNRIAVEKGRSGTVLAKSLSLYQDLLVEEEFAQKAYVQAQASLESARLTAVRQNRYLATSVQPRTAQDAQYPERLRWIFIVAFGSFVAWGILMLGTAAVKEHMS